MRGRGLFALCALAGCGLGGSGDGGRADDERAAFSVGNRDPGTLIVGRAADAISLDPARISDNESDEVCEQIYDGLLHYHPGSTTVEPGLAERWDVTGEGRVWTFHLRPGVRFHDGTPLDAAAVVFSFERMLDPHHRFHKPDGSGLTFAYAANTFKNIQEVVAIDPATVRVTIAERYAPFEANLALVAVSIVSPTAVARWGPEFYRHPVGTGPFRMVEWQAGRIVLERNPDYWDTPPLIDRLVFHTVVDGRQRLTALQSGAIDVAYSILPDELQFVELHPDLFLYRTAANNVAYLAMNTSRPPFDDVRIRRAANYAVNKEPIVKLAYQGQAVPATGPLPPTQWGYSTSAIHYDYDPARARALVAAATADGHFDPARVYQLYVPSTPRPYMPDPELVARVIQANLKAVGIKTDLTIQGIKGHLESVERGQHDLCLLGWVGDNGDPDNFLYVLLDGDNAVPGSARNLAFLRDPTLHDLLLRGQRTLGRDQRETIYRAAEDRIADLAPWVPIAHSEVAVAVRVDVGGIVINPSTHLDFKGVRRLGH